VFHPHLSLRYTIPKPPIASPFIFFSSAYLALSIAVSLPPLLGCVSRLDKGRVGRGIYLNAYRHKAKRAVRLNGTTLQSVRGPCYAAAAFFRGERQRASYNVVLVAASLLLIMPAHHHHHRGCQEILFQQQMSLFKLQFLIDQERLLLLSNPDLLLQLFRHRHHSTKSSRPRPS